MQRPNIQVEKLHTLLGHRDCVYQVVQGAEPWEVYSAGGDGFVVRWDLRQPETGTLLAKVEASVYAMHFDPLTAELVVGQNYDGLQIIDVAQRKVIGSIKLTNAAIFDIQREGDTLYVATGDGVIIVVDRRELAVRKHIKAGEDRARSIALHPTEDTFAVGYSDYHIREFSKSDFGLLRQWKAHDNSIFHLSYQHPEHRLISVSRDARFKAWQSPETEQPYTEVVAHMFAINHLAYSPDYRYFLTCSMDKSIKLWDASAYRLLKVIDKARHAGHGTSINRVLWTNYEDLVVSASDDRTLNVWKIRIETE
jgi:WD40 repeat protein